MVVALLISKPGDSSNAGGQVHVSSSAYLYNTDVSEGDYVFIRMYPYVSVCMICRRSKSRGVT